jgi:alkylated DNA repair dioxygenase AlkB
VRQAELFSKDETPHIGARRALPHLLRDGQDSVAWHGDQVARELPRAPVATVSVGAPRRFLIRPADGGPSLAFSLGWTPR